jgi:endo-1,4-beta-xylanase
MSRTGNDLDMIWSRRLAGGCLGAVAAACLVAMPLAGCSSSGATGGEGGNGGTSNGGSAGGGRAGDGSGAGGSAGAAGTGGAAPGSGGIAGSGGQGGTAGNTGAASGGHGGIAGVTGAGGIGGSGGVRGSGGITGAGGAAGSGTSKGGNSGTGGSAGIAGARGGASGAGGGGGGAGGPASTCPPATPLTGGTKYCSNSKGNANGGYAYELWSNGTGSGCMTVYGVDAKFSATWTNAGDFLARIGLQFDQTKTPAQIGTISSDFVESKTASSGLVYVGIYGWTVSPLREYYIIDDWGSSKPADVASDGTPRTKVGTITVDGDSYDVWKHTQTNKPAITGDNQTFDQYFSVRQTARQCGHISISEHFSQWGTLGLQLGKLEEAKLLLEAQNGTGTVDFTTATVVVK